MQFKAEVFNGWLYVHSCMSSAWVPGYAHAQLEQTVPRSFRTADTHVHSCAGMGDSSSSTWWCVSLPVEPFRRLKAPVLVFVCLLLMAKEVGHPLYLLNILISFFVYPILGFSPFFHCVLCFFFSYWIFQELFMYFGYESFVDIRIANIFSTGSCLFTLRVRPVNCGSFSNSFWVCYNTGVKIYLLSHMGI